MRDVATWLPGKTAFLFFYPILSALVYFMLPNDKNKMIHLMTVAILGFNTTQIPLPSGFDLGKIRVQRSFSTCFEPPLCGSQSHFGSFFLGSLKAYTC